MQNLKTELQAVSTALNSLAENVEVLVNALDKPEIKKPADKQAIEKQSTQDDQIKPEQTKSVPPKKASAKRKTVDKQAIKKPTTQNDQIKSEQKKSDPPKKASAKLKAVSRSKRKKTDTDRVVGIIKRAKRGVDIAELRRKTQFDNKKISNIVHRASKSNRIKKIDRGVYSIVED